MRDCMDGRVTSPTWGPPPPCTQALRKFPEVSRSSRAKTTAKKCTKKRATRAKLVFLLIRPTESSYLSSAFAA